MSDIFIKLISIHFQLRSPICNQKDLDIAINLVDKNERSTSLRLILTSPTGQGHGQVRRTGAPSIDTGYSSIRSQVRGPGKGNLIEQKMITLISYFWQTHTKGQTRKMFVKCALGLNMKLVTLRGSFRNRNLMQTGNEFFECCCYTQKGMKCHC